MRWKIRISDEAKKDYLKLDKSIRKQVLAGILKVSEAPLPSPQGYGKPLGNKGHNNLTGFFKIKYRGIGIRVVYTLVLNSMIMNIVVISERDDNYCYNMAYRMYQKYGDKVFADVFKDLKNDSKNKK
ncbi:MAG: type II toxin-antitoxin system RelE/ParE family toxin [Lachnospira sp.]|nr:type II toxin-antitoxin system RelE/ParE family toxin [Lachnospira sp.]